MTEFLFALENPQVYTGREINAVRKPFSRDQVNVCLVFPDKYEIGMSHYGLIILYHTLNKMVKVNAERCFLPGKPSIKTFKTHHVPLFSLENKIPLKEFDIVGFSLLSEMNYTNVLQVLDLARIPLRTRDRHETFPIIAAGGISAVNPEPLREFIDVFGIGDGEAVFPDIIAAVSEAREKSHQKKVLLHRLENIKSLYVPALYPPVKKGRFYAPELETGAIKKRVIKTIEESLPDDRVIVPLGNVVFDRLNVEIARGCPKNCRFCQAKSYYSPYRFVSLGKNLNHISEGLKETGFETFSLSTLSAGDYPYLNELLQLIPQVIAVPGISFSFSSLRPSTISHHLLSTVAMFRRTGITIAAESGTQRLRNVINKDVIDEEIFQAVELALRNKWQKIKMYFMLGLPTETMEDIEGIVHLIQQVLSMAKGAKQKIKLHTSFASFVPKPQTPLQWAKRESLKELQEKIKHIRANLKGIRHLDLDVHVPHNGVVETILARGDYRVGELLLKAFEKGEIFSAWDVNFNYQVWAELIHNSVYEEFLSEFSVNEPLPWDFLQVNYEKNYMKKEYQNALSAVPTPSCAQKECKDCNGCIYGMKQPEKKKPFTREMTQSLETSGIEKAGEPMDIVYNKIRIFYKKTGDFIFFSQLTMMKYIERLIRKSGIVFKCSRGFTPRMKITSLPPLPVFATGLDEVVEIFVEASLREKEILERLNRSAAPEGLKFKSVVECNEAPPLSRDIHFMGYEIIVKDIQQHIDDIAQHLGETDFASFSDGRLILTMDYSKQGQERFAEIYKIIDPGKERTMYLTRTHVKFKS
jgi:radical SAM family uncharacterized protein/radical SAM-linked protein